MVHFSIATQLLLLMLSRAIFMSSEDIIFLVTETHTMVPSNLATEHDELFIVCTSDDSLLFQIDSQPHCINNENHSYKDSRSRLCMTL